MIENGTNISLCCDLALNWTITQFRIEDRSVLPQLREITHALMEKKDALQMNEQDYSAFIQLLSISHILYIQQEKEDIKQLPDFENKFLCSVDPKGVNLYKFQLMNQCIFIQNRFTAALIYEFLQQDIIPMAELIKEWKTNLEPNWTNYCNEDSEKAIFTISYYKIQAYLLSQHDQLNHAHTPAIAAIQMMSSLFEFRIKRNMYKENIDSFLLQLRIFIDHVYNLIQDAYNSSSDTEGDYRTAQSELSLAYFEWNKFFILSFKMESPLTLIYPLQNYLQDIPLLFQRVVESKSHLDEKTWKQLLSTWYHLPEVIFKRDLKEYYEEVYEHFDNILKDKQIDKNDLL